MQVANNCRKNQLDTGVAKVTMHRLSTAYNEHMKMLLYILLILAVTAAAALYLSPSLRHEAQDLLQSSGLQTDTTTVYKWRSADGQWQYTQTPPPAGIPFERVEVRSDVNILPLPEALQHED